MTATTTTRKKTAPMSDSHKAALAVGRKQGAVVREYLDALDTLKPRRGRRVTPEQIRNRIAEIERNLPTAAPITRLELRQDLIDLQERLTRADAVPVLDELQREFIKVAKSWSERKGIGYTAFREVGVSPSVLKEAGIVRS